MLFHKRSYGILDKIWCGDYTKSVGTNGVMVDTPVERSVTINDIPEGERDEYLVIDSSSALARKLRMYYPFIIPVYDDNGKLIDVKSEAAEMRKEQEAKEQAALKAMMKNESEKRGYKNRFRLRQKNLMTFLKE